MKFEIVKPIHVTMVVECDSEEKALEWASKIVATIEDKDTNDISFKEVDYFEAETIVSEIKIVRLNQ